MKAQDYISSGLLEAYVLGSLDLTESEQVTGAICRFPEVAIEIAAIEALLIQGAVADAVPVPVNLEDQIWAAIQSVDVDTVSASDRSVSVTLPASEEKPAAKVVAFDNKTAASRMSSWARAAIWLALAGSVVTNFMLWSGRNSDQQQVAMLHQHITGMEQQQRALDTRLARYQQEAELMATPGMQPVAMLSTKPGQPMAATIYWNKAKSEAYVSVQKLPPAPAGMQYQLWAIAGGKPVSLGMMENEVAQNSGMQKVPLSVADGQAFAISLEKTGGNPAPTADKIYLLGKMPA